ncbi:MAG TPA: class I SAM-dependent methyltransferase [Balneolales bacterium]|nr:class I SAM-dependent methyltransferase [Balneolales bacterium]
MNTDTKIILKPGREKALKRRHPWIFSGAVQKVEGKPELGSTVAVTDSKGAMLAWAAWSPHSQIRARIWSFNPDEQINESFFKRRIQRALDHRMKMGLPEHTNAWRVVNAESDGLPGLIVDRYAEVLIIQLLSAGTEYWKDTIVDVLAQLFPGCSIGERSDSEVRSREGLKLTAGIVAGKEPEDRIIIEEYGTKFYVNVRQGHKTGFYLDQRENRQAVARYIENKRVLNAFSYTGGFGIVSDLKGAVSVTHIDASGDALDMADANIRLNNLNPDKHELVQGNVFDVLRSYRDQKRTFDLIVLDPPKFVESKAQLAHGTRGYKDINMLACQLLETGGLLATFSCSGQVDRELFQKIVADAALDAGREVQVMEWLSQAPDHAVDLAFPEGLYLKGLIGRVW